MLYMKLGKLTTDELTTSVLRHLHHTRDEVLLSAAVGEDCAALSLRDTVLVSSDPITAVMENAQLGSLCVSVCCNDVSANGGQPVAMTLTVIMPPTATAKDVDEIMRGAASKAKQLRVDIVGGHTEFSDCVTRPIISGTAIGLTSRLIKKTDVKVGDKLLVTKSLALEGACILQGIVRLVLDDEERARLSQYEKMLDVSEESKVLSQLPSVSMMHDVTEGGVLGAVAEVCYTQGKGAILYEEDMPVEPLVRKLCERVSVNPLRLISSGSMLVATSKPDEVIAALQNVGITASVIGEVTDTPEVILTDGSGKRELIEVLPDEMYKF